MANNSVVTQEVLQNTLENYHENFVYPYLNGATHAGFTPVGTVISYFGETAPEYFLICDGTEYAKSDYPQLADLLLNLTDPTPYEGSDANHFKVPDLRGEFLRGTGTNSHENQGSGGDVGEHQDATENMTLNNWGEYEIFELKQPVSSSASNNATQKADTIISDGNNRMYMQLKGEFITQTSITNRARYTSRPTNTSVLYCIAYKNIYIDLALDSFPLGISNPTDGQALVWNGTEGRWKNAGILHEYSTGEKVVGKWIDGKPIYEKTFDNILLPSNLQRQSSLIINVATLSNVDKRIDIRGTVEFTYGNYVTGSLPYEYAYLTQNSTTQKMELQGASFNPRLDSLGNLNIACSVWGPYLNYSTSELKFCITVQYTKTTD